MNFVRTQYISVVRIRLLLIIPHYRYAAVWADMVMNGEFEVTQNGNRLGFLCDGAFFGEISLLDDSFGSLMTRTVVSVTDSHLCFISAVSRLDVGCYSKPQSG